MKITFFFLLLFGICSYGFTLVKVDGNILDMAKEGSTLRIANQLVDEKMTGALSMEVMLDFESADALKDPKVLLAIETMENRLIEKYGHHITKTFSLAKIVKDTNQVMHEGKPEYYVLPESIPVTSQFLFLFESSNPEDRRALVNDNFSKTHISVMLINASTFEFKEMFQDLSMDIQEIFDPLRGDYPAQKVTVTGNLAVLMTIAQYMSESQMESFIIASITICFVMALTLGSLQGGLIAILPNLIPAVFTFGVLGLLGMPLDSDTLLVAPVIIGLAVDDTIHFITHYRDSLSGGKTVIEAIEDTIKEVGQAITFTSLILGLGFLVLTLADSGGLAKMGAFGSLGIFVALLADLFFLPALLLLFQPTLGTQQDSVANLNVSRRIA